jgi:acyl CoA:acetate/3-ketoacid CoA transferase beta subunit
LGGAMDLCTGSKRSFSPPKHVDKNGNPKILKKMPVLPDGRS